MTVDLRLGDCLEVMRQMEDKSIDFIFTDPPYGHNNNNNNDLIHRREAALGKEKYVQDDWARPIANDGAEANDIYKKFLVEANRLLMPGCCCCCCGGGGGPDPQFGHWSLWMDEIIGFKQAVIWDKGPIGMGWHYRRSYEMVLVAEKPGAPCRWYDTSHKVENIIRDIRKIIPNKNNHPTEKPVELARRFIRLHTRPGDTVLDPFMGSGTTGAACVQMDRNFIGIEIDPKYFEMAQKRITEAQAQLRLEGV
jgi:DNA modification methylase